MSAGMMTNAFGGGIGSALGGIGGQLFGSMPSSQNVTSNQNTTSNTDSSNSQSGNTSSNGVTSTNPNLPGWYDSFLQSLPAQYRNLMYKATQPVVSPGMQANYIQGVNSQYGGAQQQLQSILAKSGALNSGRAAQAQTGLMTNKLGAINNYNAQIPFQNNAAQMQYGSGLLGQGMGFKAPYGQTSTNFNNAWQNYFGNSSTNANSQTSGSQITKSPGSGLFGAIFG